MKEAIPMPTRPFKMLREAMYRKQTRIRDSGGADPADDGPEVGIIRFFATYPDGLYHYALVRPTPMQIFRKVRGL